MNAHLPQLAGLTAWGPQAGCSMEAILLPPLLLLARATRRRSCHGCQSQGVKLPGQEQYVALPWGTG